MTAAKLGALVAVCVAVAVLFTWGFTAAQDHGRQEILSELAANRQALDDLIERYEEETGQPAPVTSVGDTPVVTPGPAGADGRDGRDGRDGERGPGPTDAQVLAAVVAYCAVSDCAGPAGPVGPAGPAGDAGPAGATGPSGADGLNGTVCTPGFEPRRITGGVLDGWVACAPVGG